MISHLASVLQEQINNDISDTATPMIYTKSSWCWKVSYLIYHVNISLMNFKKFNYEPCQVCRTIRAWFIGQKTNRNRKCCRDTLNMRMYFYLIKRIVKTSNNKILTEK